MIKRAPQLNLRLGLLGKMDSIQPLAGLDGKTVIENHHSDYTVQHSSMLNCDCDFCIAFKYFLFFSN